MYPNAIRQTNEDEYHQRFESHSNISTHERHNNILTILKLIIIAQ